MKEEKPTQARLHPNPPAGLAHLQREEALGKQLQAWEETFQGWLGGYDNPETRKRMARPVQSCLSFSGMPAWEVTGEVVERYLEKELGDKSANTQYFHLKAVRSFYRYALNSPTARHVKIEANPGEAVRFTIPGMFLKARALSEEQVRKLFAAIDRDTPLGSRDYALYVTVLGSGIKGSQALRLRLGDGKLVIYIQHDKPTDPTQRQNWLPAPKDGFRFTTRLYGLYTLLIDGSYNMPGIVRVEYLITEMLRITGLNRPLSTVPGHRHPFCGSGKSAIYNEEHGFLHGLVFLSHK